MMYKKKLCAQYCTLYTVHCTPYCTLHDPKNFYITFSLTWCFGGGVVVVVVVKVVKVVVVVVVGVVVAPRATSLL